jgi:hypothetical protein
MKKEYLIILAFIAILGTTLSGCYVERGYRHPYYHYYHYR